jgi:hypothetical protein
VRLAALRSPSLPPVLWFLGLALIVAGPLLGSGYLILLDWPSGPHFAEPVWFPVPSSGDIGNLAPLNTLHTLVRAIHAYLPDKVFLLLPIVLGGWGLHRFARNRLGAGVWGAIFGGTLYAVNPFVLDRFLSGQLYILLAYSLLPWALTPLHEASRVPRRRLALLVGLWLGGLGAIDIHVAALYALLAVVVFITGSRSLGQRAISVGIAFGVGVLLWAYWLLPAILTPPGGGIGEADLGVYSSRPQGFRVLPALAAMYGFWRDEFLGPAQRIPALYLLVIPILGLVFLGAARVMRSSPSRRFALGLAATGGIALLLSAGTSFPPTAAVFRWLFEHVQVFRIFREPQKFLALAVLAYAVFGAIGLDGLRVRLTVITEAALGVVSTAAVMAYAYTMMWGFWGQVELSRYPDDWRRAEEAIAQAGSGSLLVFPWHHYAVWSFSDDRITANPAPSYFAPEVLVSGEAGFEQVPTQSPDPFTVYIDSVVAEREDVRFLGHLVAPLGVRYVVLLDEVNRHHYAFLRSQPDLESIHQGSAVVVYENTAWQPLPIGVQEAVALDSVREVIRGNDGARVTEALYDSEPLVPRPGSVIPPLAQYLSPGEGIDVVEAPFLLTEKRCTDGWRIGNEPFGCHVGAVAGFRSPGRPEELRRPAAAMRTVGLGVSTVAFVVVSLGLLLRGRTIMRRWLADRSGDLARRVAVGVALVAVVGIPALGIRYRADISESTEPLTQTTAAVADERVVKRNVACPSLLHAAEHLAAGRVARFEAAASRASRAAFRALNFSGQAFGPAERVALRLRSTIAHRGSRDEVIHALAERGLQACERF